LNHRLKTLPEHAALTELAERHSDLSAQHGKLRTDVDDLNREQRKADADVEQVKARRTRDRERVDKGLVGDPKQLQAMQHEIESLNKRISDLEDEELEVMERLETAQAQLARVEEELADVEKSIAVQTQARDVSAGDIAGRQKAAQAERDQLAAELPTDLLALYDKLRQQLGGVGAGALSQKRCGGCRLDVGAADLARFASAPPDEVLRCEECNRILIRTADSGL
jgi:predicted  nucleic acid-binding Zn-ribbon protein